MKQFAKRVYGQQVTDLGLDVNPTGADYSGKWNHNWLFRNWLWNSGAAQQDANARRLHNHLDDKQMDKLGYPRQKRGVQRPLPVTGFGCLLILYGLALSFLAAIVIYFGG